MNCKKGDLAYVFGPGAPSDGMVVRCVEFYDGPWIDTDLRIPGWLLDRPVPRRSGNINPYMADKHLRPIRPSDAEDEMLRIAGKPQDVREKA